MDVIDERSDPASAGAKLLEWIISISFSFANFLPALMAFITYLIFSENPAGMPPAYRNVGSTNMMWVFLSVLYCSFTILFVITHTSFSCSANFFASREKTYSPPPRVSEKNCVSRRIFMSFRHPASQDNHLPPYLAGHHLLSFPPLVKWLYHTDYLQS